MFFVVAHPSFSFNPSQVTKTEDGLEALVFIAEGDMRQAINNLQATVAGFGLVNADNVFKVCDQPHPVVLKRMVKHCVEGEYDSAYMHLESLWSLGYSALDIIGTLFRVVKTYEMSEYLKLEYLKSIGFVHMRITEGVSSIVQLSGLLASLSRQSGRIENIIAPR